MKSRNDGITILPLDFAHIAEIVRLEARCFSDPWGSEAFASVCENGMYTYYMAVDPVSGSICGYGGMYTVLDSADITNIAVLPDYRQRGIASQLLEALIKHAVQNGVAALHLEVRESNSAAHRLYMKFGFETDGRRKKYYRHPTEDAILMTKYLLAETKKEL